MKSIKKLINEILNIYFNYIDVKIADKRLNNLQLGKERLISSDEVFRDIQ